LQEVGIAMIFMKSGHEEILASASRSAFGGDRQRKPRGIDEAEGNKAKRQSLFAKLALSLASRMALLTRQ
jgi:hypothetical protein